MTDSISATDSITRLNPPRHVAIIMDGNNRWARQRRLSGVAGHKAGVKAVRSTVETCARQGVEILTLFAFSSENWRRPADEVSALMRLFVLALEREVKKLHRNNIRLRIIGDLTAFSDKLQRQMAHAEALTRENTRMTLVIAANYGGHWDITRAAQRLAEQVRAGSLEPSDITEKSLQQQLCVGDLPPPDLMVRTAGEQRVSNFMLWHLAYTEFHFSSVFWPDFTEAEMLAALSDYAGRKRRFGRTDDQLDAEPKAAGGALR